MRGHSKNIFVILFFPPSFFCLFQCGTISYNYITLCTNLLDSKYSNRISQYIAHIDLTTLLNHIWMFLRHQPTHMREKESSFTVMRIRIRICIFVVHPMISHPFKNVILKEYNCKEKFFHLVMYKTVIINVRLPCQPKHSRRQV